MSRLHSKPPKKTLPASPESASFADAPVGIALLQRIRQTTSGSPQYRVTYWNEKSASITGVSATTIMRARRVTISADDTPLDFSALFRGKRKGAQIVEFPNATMHVGKKAFCIHGLAWRHADNITLMLVSPDEIERSTAYFRTSSEFLDQLTDSVYFLDNHWNVLFASPRAIRYLHIAKGRSGNIVGENFLTLIPRKENPHLYETLREAKQHHTHTLCEEYSEVLNSWFEVHAHPFSHGLVVYYRDITRRKLAEAAFLKLSNAVEQSADAIFITNSRGYIEYINPAFETITGFSRSEALSRTPHFMKLDIDEPARERSLRFYSADQTREIFSATTLNRRKDGSTFSAEEIIAPVYDSHGALTHFVTTLRDISDRIQAEQSLRRSEERFRSLVENSSDGIALIDRNNIITYAGPSTERITGYGPDECLNRRYIEFIHPADRRTISQVLRTVCAHPRTPMSFRCRFLHKNGSWMKIEGTANSLLTEPSIGATVVNYRDITERENIADALSRSESEYRNLFEGANDAIIILEPETEIILKTNSRACELYGFTQDEFVGKSLKSLTKDIGRGEEQIRLLLKEKSARNFETIHFRKDGKPMQMLVNSSVVEYGGSYVIMSILRDITEMRHLEAQLRQAQKMESIGTLAGGIAHDFNNILGIVLGYASMLQRQRVTPERTADALDSITKAAQRGASMVRQILTFARKEEVLLESLDVNDVINDLVKLLSETFPKTIVFDVRLANQLPSIVADPNQIHQVLMNLCVNAKDAMGSQGKLSIETGLVHGTHIRSNQTANGASEYVHILVADSGSGMNEEIKSRMFEPFFTTKGRGGGTGLGLSVVYGIVNSHRGFIEVESELGQGTTFHLYFPVQMRRFEPTATSAATLAEIPGGTETLLVVEDEEMLLSLLKGVLESKGYKVLTCGNGDAALEVFRAKRNSIDLIVTDVGLPKLNGWEVCRKINEIKPDAKMIVASGYLDPQVKSELRNSSAREFIHKPYLPEDVLLRIRKVLDE